MIGLLAGGPNAFLVTKKGTQHIIPLLWIQSSPVDRFWYLRYIKDRIDLLDMMVLFARDATIPLVDKIGTKNLSISCSVYRS